MRRGFVAPARLATCPTNPAKGTPRFRSDETGQSPAALHNKHPERGKEELQRLAGQKDGLLHGHRDAGQGDEEDERQQCGINQREHRGAASAGRRGTSRRFVGKSVSVWLPGKNGLLTIS